MLNLVNRIIHEYRLRQVALQFREVAGLAMERGQADFLLSKAFNHAGYNGVSESEARKAAALALSAFESSGRMTNTAIERRTHEYIAQWREGIAKRERENGHPIQRLLNPSPRRT